MILGLWLILGLRCDDGGEEDGGLLLHGRGVSKGHSAKGRGGLVVGWGRSLDAPSGTKVEGRDHMDHGWGEDAVDDDGREHAVVDGGLLVVQVIKDGLVTRDRLVKGKRGFLKGKAMTLLMDAKG